MDILIDRIKARAYDPVTATDQGFGHHFTVTDGRLEPVRYVANPPASPQMVASAEQALGLQLPELLKRLYLEVGNGGFGPGYGLLPLPVSSDEEETMVSLYTGFQATAGGEDGVEDAPDPWFPPPPHLVPICDWGCAIYSLVDCSAASYAIVRFDTTQRTGTATTPEVLSHEILAPERASLVEWLEAWLAGERLFYAVFDGAGGA